MSTDIEKAVALLALRHHTLPPQTAAALIQQSRATGRPLIRLLLDAVPETAVFKAVGTELGTPFYDLYSTEQRYTVDESVLRRADMAVLKRLSMLPLVDRTGHVVVAVANPTDLDGTGYLARVYGDQISLVLATAAQIQAQLIRHDASAFDTTTAAARPARAQTRTQAAPPPTQAGASSVVVEYIDRLLEKAVSDSASDVHIEFNEDETLLVRLRVDGTLRQVPAPLVGREREVVGALLSKTETMDPSNTREPQDGTFSFTAAGRKIDARVALLPQLNGPQLVLRLLDSMTMRTRLDDMGFSPENLRILRRAMTRPQGTLLLCGPTGSGKTTTLYGLLREVDAVTKKVLTVEDPVEYRLPYVGQTQIRSDLGERSLTFARALRAILRLDPDVILVGEIRDTETAKTAMDAAITGHLVLSTLHAQSSIGAYTRLSEMGVPTYAVSEALSLVVSQRLVKRLHSCARLEPPTAEEARVLTEIGLDQVPAAVGRAVGCASCGGSGYRGRLAVIEVLEPTPRLRALVAARAAYEELEREALAGGYAPMQHDALRLVAAGATTVSELVRVVQVEVS